jgi:SAM-dependent methyltransferase
MLAGARAENFPPTLVATEGWPPNVAKATSLLHPLGAVVVADPEEPPLPFADDAFDLVTSRHPATVHWSEIARVLVPGGTYFAQHVGSGTNVEISEYFLGPVGINVAVGAVVGTSSAAQRVVTRRRRAPITFRWYAFRTIGPVVRMVSPPIAP